MDLDTNSLLRECARPKYHSVSVTSRSLPHNATPCSYFKSCSPRHIVLSSKPVFLILLWTFLLGCIYATANFATPLGLPSLLNNTKLVDDETILMVTMYCVFALVSMFYPLGGLLGDVWLGRYRTVVLGLVVVLACVITASIDTTLLLLFKIERSPDSVSSGASIFSIGCLAYILLIVGFSTVNSNIVQLGLDQLMEAPSESLGVFVHWFVWAGRLGQLLVQIVYTARRCTEDKSTYSYAVFSLPYIFLVLLLFFVFSNCCIRKRFNTERVKYNPYKMIVKVLNFARKNKYPVGYTTAFAYCDDTIPSRIDYAKERYGGPFTTSDVEDVKTFIRVFCVLLTLGPVFVLVVSSSVLFPVFAIHSGQNNMVLNNSFTCTMNWMLLESGTLSGIITVVILPVYMWIVYSLLRNRALKILYRLGFSICLYILAIVSMFAIDLTGHIVLYVQGKHYAVCMFVEPILEHTSTNLSSDLLDLHWSVLILPNMLKSIAPDLIMATAFEFISAQSPHTMKGVLVGILFAISGLFKVFGAVFFVPFALHQVWKRGYLGEDPPVTNCGFGYYLVTISVALVGLCLFVVAVKKYKYRKRDEEPYSQSRVEEIFSRRIQQRPY